MQIEDKDNVHWKQINVLVGRLYQGNYDYNLF